MDHVSEKGFQWRKDAIDRQKEETKSLLDAQTFSKSRQRLQFIMERIHRLENDHSGRGCIQRYLFIVHALLHHSRFGGLNASQVKNLFQLGQGILKLNKIQSSSSKLGFLYGDLHLVQSFVLRREGRKWQAGWEQQISFYLSQRSKSSRAGFQSLSVGIQLLRMGHADQAIEELKQVRSSELSPSARVRAQLEELKCYRLMRNEKDFDRVYEILGKTSTLSPDECKEREWEHLSFEAQQTGDIQNLVAAVLSKRSHHDPEYILDAFLWTRVVSSREWMNRYPSLRKLAPNISFKRTELGILSRCVMAMEEAYDSEIPYLIRLQKIGDLLSQCGAFRTTDHELLVWAAVARWLSRQGSNGFLNIVLSEYRSLSLSLSLGKNPDSLGILADLLNKIGTSTGGDTFYLKSA